MRKIIFIPISIGGGIAAGLVGKKLFEQVWRMIDEEEPPEAKQREVDYRKLVAALALEGALFRVVRGVFDHSSRRGFAALTGAWPGEQAPDPN